MKTQETAVNLAKRVQNSDPAILETLTILKKVPHNGLFVIQGDADRTLWQKRLSVARSPVAVQVAGLGRSEFKPNTRVSLVVV